MNAKEQKKQAKLFVERWKNKGSERKDSQSFWLDLLQSVYGIENPSSYISFEDKVMLDHTSFIDGYIDETKVLIEQKSKNKGLHSAIKQSDGTFLTPFQQAKRYAADLPYSKRPRWIITCNFREFYVYDMEQPNSEAVVILLEDLPDEFYRLEFLVTKSNEHLERELQISMQAGDIVREIYEALIKQYVNPESEHTLHAMNQLIVRLVFCFYAEDALIFGSKMMFHDYLSRFEARDFRRALIDLFEILDTPVEERNPYLDDELLAFPYVNGGMFSEKNIEIPRFTDELRELILEHASSNFDWSKISPTIFGAVFESTLNPDTRRKGGMHYTSIENIHKVIDPLFLDDLRNELNEIRKLKQFATIKRRVEAFQKKLGNLTFLDPACGSGNFLTETYLSLRRLENEALKLTIGREYYIDTQVGMHINVKINQFYGIEINDFAVSVAKTALWIAESQMLEETNDILYANEEFLPLKSYTNIVEGNALKIDWNDVVPKNKLNYIIGNPPFLGYSLQSKEQKEQLKSIYVDENNKPYKTSGKNDFVSAWYFKASQYIINTNIRVAFVSTNSITQGEQVSSVWKPLFERFQIQIDFAYQTFKWDSEASEKAAVHCVIIGFSQVGSSEKKLFGSNNSVEKVSNINFYLKEGKPVFLENRTKPISDVIEMTTGNRPADGGHLIIEADEYEKFINHEPKARQYIKCLTGAAEFINNKNRYCLWLVGVSPATLRTMPLVMERIEACRQSRLSGAADRQKLADTPMLFREQKNPETYIIIPSTSSENRRYIPIGFLDSNTIPTNSVSIIENASIYDFGILTSNVHMAWMRTVAGRLEMRYRYSAKIVYNNFPWPNPTSEQKEKIKETAQAILDARSLYPDSSLADLYDELTMPVELRRAHQENDKAVMKAYGFTKKVNGNTTWLTESETVAKLFDMYREMTKDE
ncbi:class I SAM-dependent DNA methyltransferase [Enterococcus cecorum]|nr:class I SAM-dependent DNA methyltransferase [Clostridiales bacterium]CAI3419496.1 class I SAM-dependent DNA methyltransferase [Enterococcus cecorum]CAI3436808.1 class I SAM-dependent DNA methyltransferase [Enterococcus cecorum]